MKTIRLLYPDFVSGGLETYYLGARLMAQIVPQNPAQPLFEVPIEAPAGREYAVTRGISGLDAVLSGIKGAQSILEREQPDKVITIGGSCLVSLPAFDYLHARGGHLGILWIDAHPDVSTPEDGYPNAHAMVLGTLLGGGAPALKETLSVKDPFSPADVLYVGLQGLHSYQREFLDKLKVNYQVQTEHFVEGAEITAFLKRFDQVLVHLDIDVLDPAGFAATYFANPSLVGDGSGGGRMSMEQLHALLALIGSQSEIAALSVAEYLPFKELELQRALAQLPIFSS